MITREAKRILDRAGFEVVRAAYVKVLKVRSLPIDAAEPVQFNDGQVRLGDVDHWLRRKDRASTRLLKTSVMVGIIAAAAAIVAAVPVVQGWLGGR